MAASNASRCASKRSRRSLEVVICFPPKALDADRLFDEATEDVAALQDQGGELLAQLEGQASAAVVQALMGG